MRMKLLSMLTFGLFALSVYAADPVIDGITYQIYNMRAYIGNGSPCSGVVEIPEYIEHEGNRYEVSGILNYSFQNNKEITGLIIPKTFRSIYLDAFVGCDNLTEIHIKDLSAWCNIAFALPHSGEVLPFMKLYMNGEEIKDLVIPENVKSISNYAFIGEWKNIFTDISFPEGLESIGASAFSGCSVPASVHIPNTVTSIGSYAFQNCNSLHSITLSENLKRLEGGILNECSNLENIVIPENVTAIDESVFMGCRSLKEMSIPDKVEEIGQWAFCACASLENVFTGNGVKKIGECAFQSCESLQEISISGTTEIIGKSAFSNCSSLTELSLAEGIREIGANAFEYCQLSRIELPSSIEKIGEFAFQVFTYFPGMENYMDITKIKEIKEIICHAEKVPSVVSRYADRGFVTKETYETATLYVPETAIKNYKADKYWGQFKEIKAIEDKTNGIEIVHSQKPKVHNGFYDLQGRKLPKAPEKGMYLMKSKSLNSKFKKVLIK